MPTAAMPVLALGAVLLGLHGDPARTFLIRLNGVIGGKALARIAIILRGGAHADVNARLARLALPGIHQDLAVTTPKLRIVWNPQGFGAPDVPGNSAQAYYPGDAYVDVVGDDLYDMRGHGAT